MTNTKRASALILAVAIFGDASTVFAQAVQMPAASPVSAPIASAPTAMTDGSTVRLLAGRSTIVDVGAAIARVSLTSPDVADAVVTTPTQLLVNGKVPGTISMFVWDRAGALRRFEVNVGRDMGQLSDQMRSLFPGEQVAVTSTGKNVVLSGNVSSKDVADKIASVATGYVEKKEEVVSLLQVRQAPAASQVLLRVRFAEVSRSALSDLGASLYADGAKNLIGRSTTGQFGQPAIFDQQDAMVGNTQVFSDFLNLFLFSYKHQVGAVIKALQTRGLFQSLAEPNLVAESGKEASFLAGGEIPVPVVQGSGGSIAVSVMWKEFGVRLNFTPTVNGNNVRLKVRPEVSTLDFGNAITLQGFRIPALSTRRTETELELENGQTFAIAGLMNNNVSTTMRKIPGIGDIPVLGALFRSKAAQKDQTELVVMITPEILKLGSPGVSPNLPRGPEKFMEPIPEKKTQEMPAPAFTAARPTSVTAAAPVPAAPSRTPSAKSPAMAAAAVSALTPNARPMANAAKPTEATPALSSLPQQTVTESMMPPVMTRDSVAAPDVVALGPALVAPPALSTTPTIAAMPTANALPVAVDLPAQVVMAVPSAAVAAQPVESAAPVALTPMEPVAQMPEGPATPMVGMTAESAGVVPMTPLPWTPPQAPASLVAPLTPNVDPEQTAKAQAEHAKIAREARKAEEARAKEAARAAKESEEREKNQAKRAAEAALKQKELEKKLASEQQKDAGVRTSAQ